MSVNCVILADGAFPTNKIPLHYMRNAHHLVCCDGAVREMIKSGFEPEAIIGDLDSIDPGLSEKFSDRLFRDNDQETNDLTKAVNWCIKRGYDNLIIVGATGKREDHTIGNISLLAEYSKNVKVIMVTDTGTMTPILETCRMSSFPGQQVSIFSINTETEILSVGLKYELNLLKLHNWWRATLNESIGESFELRFSGGPLIVYQKFGE